MTQRYDFRRIREGVGVMAQGIAVHADSLGEAERKANAILRGNRDAGNPRTDRVEFQRIGRCAAPCSICEGRPS